MSADTIEAGAVAAVDIFAVVDQLVAGWPFVVDGPTETLRPDANAAVVAFRSAAAARVAVGQPGDARTVDEATRDDHNRGEKPRAKCAVLGVIHISMNQKRCETARATCGFVCGLVACYESRRFDSLRTGPTGWGNRKLQS